MARPPLVLGTWGRINRTRRGKAWVAFARFRDFDGVTRQIEKSGATGRKAEDALLTELRGRARVAGASMTGESSVEDLSVMWWAEFEQQGRAPQTLESYRRVLRVHVLPGLGSVRLREASVPNVERFLTAVRKNAGASQAKLCRVVLTAMFALAVRHGAMPSNPARETASVRTQRSEIRTVDLDEVVMLRRLLREWDAGRDRAGNLRVTDLADPIDMLLASGVRTGELLALRWRDVTLGERPTVEVNGTVTLIEGTGLVRQGFPKSDTSNRALYLPVFAAEMLARRRKARQSDWVFPSSTGTLRSPSNFRRQWRDFRAAQDYPTWMVPKTFRKTVATLVRDNVDLDTAGAQLGHANTRVTEAHYAKRQHVGPDVSEVLQQFGA